MDDLPAARSQMAAAALGTLFALWRRRYRAAWIGAVLQVSLIIWGWPSRSTRI